MPEFSLDEPLGSCRVDKDLIRAIEKYLINDLPDRLGLEDGEPYFILKIADGVGKEVFDSIEEFAPKQFPDGTKSVEVSWRGQLSGHDIVHVRMRFDASSFLNSLSISAECPTAREVVMGIRERLRLLLDPYRTLNWLFNPLAVFFAGGLALVIGPAIALNLLSSKKFSSFPLIILVIAVWYWLSGSKLQPYTTFDTRVQARLSGAWKWLSLGFLGFVLFGTLLPQFRRALFGF